MKSIAVIVGSAFTEKLPPNIELSHQEIATPWGKQDLYQIKNLDRSAYLLFRHGIPHQLLPNQINYRAQARALKEINCGALMVTSSVGVLDANLPLYRPLLVTDLMMLENRLPDGTTCTMFVKPEVQQGHLVLNEGLFSKALTQQVYNLAPELIFPIEKEVIFAYVGGPRGKTAAENKMWYQLGASVNSMTLAPEVVLANELEIPCVGLVVGHKYSLPGKETSENRQGVRDSLVNSRSSMERIIIDFLKKGSEVPFKNQIFRFTDKEG